MTSSPDPLIGQTLGEYRVERLLGAGGMGLVYAATQPSLRRQVAIKVIRPELAASLEDVERFEREARIVGSIRHRGIVGLHTVGDLPGGGKYLVMEYLEGETLESLLRREGRMKLERALPLLEEVLDALSAAHGAGVVHRDVKPANVFLARQSNGAVCVKLMDFGLARRFEGGTAPGRTWTMAGTPEYLSPEQLDGTPASGRTDLYGFGVMAFEVLSGGLPFGGSSAAEYAQAHLERAAPRLSAYLPVPPELDRLVASLLEKEPGKRPASAELVRRELARIERGLGEARTQVVMAAAPAAAALEPTAPQGSPLAEPGRRARRSPVIALAVGLAAGLGGVALYALDEPATSVAPPPARRPLPAAPPPKPVDQKPVDQKPPDPAKLEAIERQLAELKKEENDAWEDRQAQGFSFGCGGPGWRREAQAEIARIKAQRLAALAGHETAASVEFQAQYFEKELERPDLDCLHLQRTLENWKLGRR